MTKTWNEIKTKWLEALRSGTYKQTDGVLRRYTDPQSLAQAPETMGYCCLGVLAEVVQPGSTVCDWQWVGNHWRYLGGGEMAGHSVLGYAFMSKNHLDQLDADASIDLQREAAERRIAVAETGSGSGSGSVADVLMALNDSGNVSFAEIADIIDKHL